jgi:ADP-ribose pyrophosphatase
LSAADPHLVEQCLDGTTLVSGGFLEVRRDRVRLPDGNAATREYIVHPGAVAIVPLLPDGRIVLVRQYRYPLGRVLLEVPAGKLDAGESPLECAKRELAEETGYTAAEWASAGAIHNAPAYSTELLHFWFARSLSAGAAAREAGEFLEVVEPGIEQLDAMAARGELTDVKTLHALLWLQRWRSGAWALNWRKA